jgi:hypothetical protein
MVLMHLGLIDGPFVPHNLIPVQGSPVLFLKFQMDSRLKILTSSGSKKKEPRYTCLSAARVSHLQRMWAKVVVSCTVPVGNVLWMLFQEGWSSNFRLRQRVGQTAHTRNNPHVKRTGVYCT